MSLTREEIHQSENFACILEYCSTKVDNPKSIEKRLLGKENRVVMTVWQKRNQIAICQKIEDLIMALLKI